jgi:hypothetical protein
VFLLLYVQSFAQCMLYPVSLEERIQKSSSIVLGSVSGQVCYTDKKTGLIYTRNTITVDAWVKGSRSDEQVVVITLGGVNGNRAMMAEPSLQLKTGDACLFFLEADNRSVDHKELRLAKPGLMQALPFADVQGALVMNNYIYTDRLAEPPMPESTLLTRIESITCQKARTPSGKLFTARTTGVFSGLRTEATNSVSGFTPATVNSGTIEPGDVLTITGTGFGASRGAGSVAFANADDGGATFITPPVTSDYISWSNTSISVRVPRRAGTGIFRVVENGGTIYPSPSPLSVNYAHLSVETNFLNFASSTRQRYYLRNLNGVGGYTFTYNTTFSANTAATASFQRALNNWRCGTGVNFRLNPASTAVATAADDGINVVSFDATLPAGVLARATTYFEGSGIPGICEQTNTVLWADGLDIVFNQPPFTGFTWQYGPAAPSAAQFDFESVALHELGHLHGLGHVIAPGDVMHYSLTNGAQSRILAPRDLSGGNSKMAYSTAATCFNPASAGTPMTAITSGCALPLQLLEFTGRRAGAVVQLLWQTQQEFNNAGFEVQRSADGSRFEPLSFVTGKNFPGENKYVFTDSKAGYLSWYYRLKQVDEGGRFTYSSVVPVAGENTQPFLVWSSESGHQLSVLNNGTAPLWLEVFHNNGQLLVRQRINGAQLNLSTAHWVRGLYVYRITSGKQTASGKLVLGTN